jgi:predicted MPP superfamily phosphohydrolase
MWGRSPVDRAAIGPVARDRSANLRPARRPARLLRRALAGVALAGGLGLILVVYGVLIEPDRLVVRDMAVTTLKWPADLPPLTVAVVGDLHAGALHIDAGKIDRVVDLINDGRPDLIVLLGDFLIQGVLFGTPWSPSAVAARLARLQAPNGVFAVLGNHDWYGDGHAVWQALEAAGITVIENAARPLPGRRIWIAGIADDTTRTPDPEAAVAGIPADAAVIAITHDPAPFPQVPARVALTLAGHTHGGQVSLPGVGPLFNASRAPLAHTYGLVREGDALLFVTAGIGTSILPIRFNRPPEIVFLRLGAPAAGDDPRRR